MKQIKSYIIEKLHINKDTDPFEFMIDQVNTCLRWFIKNIYNYGSYQKIIENWIEDNNVTDIHVYVPNNQTKFFMATDFKSITKNDYFWHRVEFTTIFDGIIQDLIKDGGEFSNQEIQLDNIYTWIGYNKEALWVIIRVKNYENVNILFVKDDE